jgi:DNA modification methylase
MEIKHVPIGSVHPNPENPRVVRDEQFRKLKKSLQEFPEMLEARTLVVVTDGDGYVVLGGNQRLKALKELGVQTVPVFIADHWPADKRREFVIKDNVSFGDWNFEELVGWGAEALTDWGMELPKDFGIQKTAGLTDADDIPETPKKPTTRLGDVWILGDHRVMCGDSTVSEDIAKLMNGELAALLHADPPYGMGKEADGVMNDNLYNEKLDKFQMQWWSAYRQHLLNNASAYIWGNAPEIWSLWYRGGLSTSERLELRNEIVWDKRAIAGMASPDLTQYPIATERCLFFQLGNQFLGNVNADDFPESWEPLRSFMEIEAQKGNIGPRDIHRICGCQMYGHWFTRSQFTLIPEKHYRKMAQAYPGLFVRAWKELKAEWDRVKGRGRDVINGKLSETRAYFDNSHDIMRDVWEFQRVTGEERYGHATPKPVAMMERVMTSSLPEGGLSVEPFGGSGSTLMGAQKTGRRCFTMEMQPNYVDVTVMRWQAFTGKEAVLEETGHPFAQTKEIRRAE